MQETRTARRTLAISLIAIAYEWHRPIKPETKRKKPYRYIYIAYILITIERVTVFEKRAVVAKSARDIWVHEWDDFPINKKE